MVKSIDSNSWYPTLVAAGALGLGVGLFAKFNSFKPGGELVGLPHFSLSNRRFVQITATTTLVGLTPKALLTLLSTDTPLSQEPEGIEAVFPELEVEGPVAEKYNELREELLNALTGDLPLNLEQVTKRILRLHRLYLLSSVTVGRAVTCNGKTFVMDPDYQIDKPFTLPELRRLTPSMVADKIHTCKSEAVRVIVEGEDKRFLLSYADVRLLLGEPFLGYKRVGSFSRYGPPPADQLTRAQPAITFLHENGQWKWRHDHLHYYYTAGQGLVEVGPSACAKSDWRDVAPDISFP